MSRRQGLLELVSLVGIVLGLGARPAAAEDAPWAPLRLGGAATVAFPLEGELILTSVELHVLQQVGRVTLDGSGHGSAPIAGIGGQAGLGTFESGADGACADEVDADGDTRWTCGQLTLGPTAMVGWAWGSKLETGMVRQDTLLYLRATPHLALSKNPERAFAEVRLAGGLGVAFRPFQLEVTYIKVPGDAYVGFTIGASASVSGWLVNDREAPEVTAADSADAIARAAEEVEEPTRLRIDLAAQALAPVASADGESVTGVGVGALSTLRGFPRDPSRAWHRWVGFGGELRLAGSERPEGDSAAQVGPTAMVGVALFDGEHPLFSAYGRASPFIGWRARGDDDSFDVGATVAAGVTVGMPDHLSEDGEPPSDTGALSLGFELVGGWMRGATYLGAGVGMVFW